MWIRLLLLLLLLILLQWQRYYSLKVTSCYRVTRNIKTHVQCNYKRDISDEYIYITASSAYCYCLPPAKERDIPRWPRVAEQRDVHPRDHRDFVLLRREDLRLLRGPGQRLPGLPRLSASPLRRRAGHDLQVELHLSSGDRLQPGWSTIRFEICNVEIQLNHFKLQSFYIVLEKS